MPQPLRRSHPLPSSVSPFPMPPYNASGPHPMYPEDAALFPRAFLSPFPVSVLRLHKAVQVSPMHRTGDSRSRLFPSRRASSEHPFFVRPRSQRPPPRPFFYRSWPFSPFQGRLAPPFSAGAQRFSPRDSADLGPVRSAFACPRAPSLIFPLPLLVGRAEAASSEPSNRSSTSHL